MKIYKAPDDRQCVTWTDACSCLTFFMANQIGSKDIARVGNYSSAENGSIIGDGRQMLDTEFGLVLRQQAIPMGRNCLATPNVERFSFLSPTALMAVHCQFHPGIDVRSQCKALGLTAQKCDAGDRFARCFVDSSLADWAEQRGGKFFGDSYENTVYKNMAAMYSSSAGTTQPIYQRRREIYSFFDHENIFQKVEYFDGKNLFLMKFFKWNNVNGVFALLFAPDTPGIWLNPGHNFSSKLYLSTNIHTVHGNGKYFFFGKLWRFE